ncbi:flagellum-specific peptidoglycan hydrolase FlgJ [Mucilaginibacter gracilis]|uniref:Flagellum-specific peptidoglycan hydrolase FlgJ n=1 Tax=Mucilaginibacter gracilis TaxID=423350 RepID=A0A495IWT8_9SPHI|nr:glucosaminidase domain-containing protein [Mucilaginibacter gracilis]RKR81140.1 flagellum-specific peptidoglycan hydrolase FlgJ [Mucilaginibacter gracilis]
MKKTVLIVLLFIAAQASAQNTSKSYIEKFKDDAIRIMHQTGIPASITLAIAMHESGCGNSVLAQHLNNQFGMKGNSVVVYKRRHKRVSTLYKQYNSIAESFEDFARVITEKKKFSGLSTKFTHYDYLGWVHGIQKAGYASSRKWGAQVLSIITKYQLNTLDETPEAQPNLAAALDDVQ